LARSSGPQTDGSRGRRAYDPDAMAAAQRILVIIPAFNEEAALPETIADLRQHRPDVDVVVVDDGSRDRTAEVARAAGIDVAVLPFNLGVGGALRTGFLLAVERDYDVAIQFDADGQHDAKEIATLLGGIDGGADMVIGTRFGDGAAAYEVSRIRGMAMGLLRWVVRALSGLRITDTSSGFRAFSRPLLELFSRNYPVDYLGDTVEALILAHRAGFQVVEVPTSMRPRAAGTASNRRLRLAYHYVRLLLILASTAQRRRRTNAA
jgi:glycosyltransferase involved in cell wall biosynthesis